MLKHLFASGLGIIFVIFGTFALAAYLTRSRAGRLGLVAMVIAVFGHALFLMIGGVSAFASPVEGQAYLAGMEEIEKLPSSLAVIAQTATFGVSVLLGFVGNVLLGVAVWRSGILPKWAGALWAFAPVLMYVFGIAYALTIGANATIVCGHTIGEYAFIAAGAVVTQNVPAFALMAGVPARRIGWMSHAGDKLGPDLVCPRSGRRYRETGPGRIEEIV